TNAVRVPVGMKAQTVAILDKTYSDAPLRYVESFEYYRIRRGDTLSGIAHKFRTSIAYIRELNNMNRRSTFIRVGQRLKVPDGPKRSVAKSRSSSSARPLKGSYHVVRRG